MTFKVFFFHICRINNLSIEYTILLVNFVLISVFSRRILEGSHASFVESVPYKTIATFTVLQFLYFAICYGLTWIPIGGILFPLPFFLLIAIRERLLPKLFDANYLQELDASEYEEIIGAPHNIPLMVKFYHPFINFSMFFIPINLIKYYSFLVLRVNKKKCVFSPSSEPKSIYIYNLHLFLENV